MTEMRRRVLLTAALLALAATCGAGQEAPAAPLRRAVAGASDSSFRRDLERVYEGHGWEPLWIGPTGPLPRAESLLASIARAADDGLDPGAYGAADVRTLLGLPDGAARAAADERLSEAFLRLGRDLAVGRVAPSAVDSLWSGGGSAPDLAAALETAVRTDDVAAALDALRPDAEGYAGLRRSLAGYRAIGRRGGWPILSDGPDLVIGDSGARVAVLRTRLALTDGPLSAGDPPRFDEELARAVRRFQRRNGLTPDGIVGVETRRALALPVADRIATIELNLERWRWLPRTLPGRYFLVNIPAFAAQLHDSGRVVMRLRAIVGRPDWPTPVTSAWLSGVTFRPEWNVPRSIAVQEILPLERARPGYLRREGFLVRWRDSAVAVDPDSVRWDAVDTTAFPYRLIQAPGPGNPLGAIRFDVDDPFNVAIHDTPQHALFGERVRLFSHGCVRVEGAASLVARLLPGWTADRVRAALVGEPNRTVLLPDRLPVFLTYQTAWTAPDGSVQFRADVYGWDAELGRALEAARAATAADP